MFDIDTYYVATVLTVYGIETTKSSVFIPVF